MFVNKNLKISGALKNKQLRPEIFFAFGALYDTIAFGALANIWKNALPLQTFPELR